MNSLGISEGIHKTTDWIMKVAYINILWIFFSIFGLVILGVFPATTAMFAICRKLQIGESDIPIFRTFWKVFKKEFWKSNLLGLMIAVVSIVIYVDYLFFIQGESLLLKVLLFPFLTLAIAVFLTVLFLFPTYVHYDAKLKAILKNAFLIPFINPLMALLMIISTIVIYIAMVSIPGLIPFFGASILAWIYMYFALKCFNRIDKEKADASKETSLHPPSHKK